MNKTVRQSPTMPWSPMDAILDGLRSIPSRLSKDDTVMTVLQRKSDVLTPIIKRIKVEAYNAAIDDAAKVSLNIVSDNMDTCDGYDVILIEDARTIEHKIKELKQ